MRVVTVAMVAMVTNFENAPSLMGSLSPTSELRS
jgi:hypothetical protein